MKKLSLILLALMFVCTVSSCTKKNNCEMVKGVHRTGYFKYFDEPVYDKTRGIFLDSIDQQIPPVDDTSLFIIGFSENSIPQNYRKNGLIKQVFVSYELPSGISTLEYTSNLNVYKLKCIEDIK